MSALKNKWIYYYDQAMSQEVLEKLQLLSSRLELIPFKETTEIVTQNKKTTFVATQNLKKVINIRLNSPLVIFTDLSSISKNELLKLSQNNFLEGVFSLEKILLVLDPYFKNTEVNSQSSYFESVKNINRFAQRVSKVASLPDLLLELRSEFRSIKKINTILLAVNKLNEDLDLLFFQGDKIRATSLKAKTEEGSRMRKNHPQDRNLLASTMGRPVAKILAVPILGGVNPVTVFVEHDLSDLELNSLMDFLSQRLQVIETILDVLLIERRLNEASQLWEKTFEGISDPVAIVDRDYNLLRGNKKFRQFKQKKKCYEVFFNREEPCPTCPLLNLSDEEPVTVGNIRFHNHTFEVHSSPIYLYNKTQIAGFANHYIDQTETLSLKSRIIQSEKIAAIGHLAGNIAHELNNPLTGIRSLSQLLIQEMDPKIQMAEDLKEVEIAASRCQKIITNLLEYTKGQQEALSDVSLNQVVDKTVPMLKSALRPFNLNIEHKVKPVWVKANEQMLQQVLFNIILNSTQAMVERGEIEVTVDKLGENAILKVKDTGPGIPEDIQNQVFEPFFTTKAKGKGTGLGLSMVKKVVESFSGKVQLQSQQQKGTEITLYFPLQSP